MDIDEFIKNPELIKGNVSLECNLRPLQMMAYCRICSVLKDSRYFQQTAFSSEAFIVQMATGSGKTGVIALSAWCLEDYKRILIIVTSDSLRTQLARDINPDDENSFWNKIGYTPERKADVRKYIGRRLLDSKRSDVYIDITVIHSIVEVGGINLKGKYDLILFDEGHKKGAPRYDEEVQAIAAPMILFTATPYRSDGRPLGANPVFKYTIEDVWNDSDQILRKPKFKSTPGQLDELVKGVKNEYQQIQNKWGDSVSPRIVIRCGTGREVLKVVNYFRNNTDLKAAGIHTNFSRRYERHLTDDASNIPEACNVLVHQNMLIEGFDDSRVAIVVFREEVADGKVFIQHIGRALRYNRSAAKNREAIVFYPNKNIAEQRWDRYLSFERDPSKFKILGSDFSPLIEKMSEDIESKVEFNPSVQIRHANNSKRIIQCDHNAIHDWLENKNNIDVVAEKFIPMNSNQSVSIFILVKRSTPSFLRDSFFENLKLSLICIVSTNRFHFIQNTSGIMPDLIRSFRLVEPKQLQMIVGDSSTKLFSASLKSVDHSLNHLHAKSYWASDLNSHIFALKDGSFVPKYLSWWNSTTKNVERITLNSGKFSSSEILSLDRFKDWCFDLQKRLLHHTNTCHAIFDKLAKHHESTHKLKQPFLARIEIPNSGSLLLNSGENIPHAGFLFFDFTTKIMFSMSGEEIKGPKIELDCTRIPKLIWAAKSRIQIDIAINEEKQDLLKVINSRKRFTIFDETGIVYTNGSFYKRQIPNKNHHKLLIEYTGHFKPEHKEGPKDIARVSIDKWARNTLFDDFETAYGSKFNLLICDDDSGEVADFIGITWEKEQRKIVYIHIKSTSKKTRGLRIDDLYVVLSQASKSLPMIRETPSASTLVRWQNRHSTGLPRIRFGRFNKNNISKTYMDPSSLREIWVIQPGVSKERYMDQFNTRRHHKISFLVDHLAISCHQFGVKLKILT